MFRNLYIYCLNRSARPLERGYPNIEAKSPAPEKREKRWIHFQPQADLYSHFIKYILYLQVRNTLQNSSLDWDMVYV